MNLPLEIVVHGDVGPAIRAYARDKISRIVRFVTDPILSAHVALRVARDAAAGTGRSSTADTTGTTA